MESKAEASSERCQMHGVLVRVFETGVLLIGESGIGKSECALDLITKGHQFCADDSVEIFSRNETLVGRPPGITRHLLEIRGLGIINVPEIFGGELVCDESAIDLCVELRKWVSAAPLENATTEYSVAGQMIPKYVLPVSPGRNLSTLVETAVRLHRLGGSRTIELLVAEHARLLDLAQ